MRVLIVVNTHSGGGDAGIYDYARALGTSGVEIVFRFAEPGTSYDDLVSDAVAFDAIVAAGGDGTASAVCYASRSTGVPVLVYPAGTANLLALNLGLPLDARELAEITLAGTSVAFDMGELECGSGGPNHTRSGFMVTAGAGYDAAIMESAQPMKSMVGPAAYLLAAVGNVAPTQAEFEITLDGETLHTDGIAVLLVNFGRLQFDIAVTRGWDPRDGMLDVAVVRAKNAAELLPVVVAAMLDKRGEYPEDSPAIDVYRAKTVEVIAEPPLRVQYDGEVLEESTPLSARSLPGAATLIVPPDSPFLEGS